MRGPLARIGVALALLAAPAPASGAVGVFAHPAAAPRLAAAATTLPPGFTESIVWSGLGSPTVLRFAPDGRVFVATKSGLVYVFDGLDDATPSVFADLRGEVFDAWDRGLLGLAIDPTRPYVYVLYSYDRRPGFPQVPYWRDNCPTPPGPTTDGCEITGRLSRLSATGAETALIEDFCQQYPSHSVGSLSFGPDGELYVSGGDGASYSWADYGQNANKCGDPPGAVGTGLAPPAAQGGALRSQSFRRDPSQPAVLDGAILRVDPDTGAAAPGNPAAASSDPQRRRIVAYGFRNPFRFTFRPGTGELWAGDVGWGTWEEIDRVPDIAHVRNYGWPCYEGAPRQAGYDALDLASCEDLYAQGGAAVVAPHFAYLHSAKVVPGEPCPSGGASISGLAFATGTAFPAAYRDALFFADYSRQCIWVMPAGAGGLPDPGAVRTFAAGAAFPADLEMGPDGALYYADVVGGTIRRIAGPNHAPTARIAAAPTAGVPPLTVAFDGTGSTDPDGQALTYAWDLDGDGAYDDSTATAPSFTYTAGGPVTVRLRVTDPDGASGTATQLIAIGTPPAVAIAAPAAGTTWAVGDAIAFAGSASPGAALRWSLDLRHCSRSDPTVCHAHHIQDFDGASGSFAAPDHEYPAYLELSLTATGPDGLTASRTVRLDPRTADLTLASSPPGLRLAFAGETATAPFTRRVIARSVTSVGAPSPQSLGERAYAFGAWSDGLGRTHAVIAPAAGAATYTATFRETAEATLAGTGAVGSNVSVAWPGGGEVYRVQAAASGDALALRVRLDEDSTAAKLILGLYGDVDGEAGPLLASGTLSAPEPGAWNEVRLPAAVPVKAGTRYWLALLQPLDSAGVLRWRDRPGSERDRECTSASHTLTALPDPWLSGFSYDDGGPVSGSVVGALPDAPPAAAGPGPPPPAVLGTPTPPPGPVGAWGFEEAGGATAADASGHGNAGTIAGARRTAGRFGRGLAFDGAGDWVTVHDSPSLRPATGVTVEGWVYPTARGAWRAIAVKEARTGLAWGLYAGGRGGLPSGHASTPGERWAAGARRLPLNAWSHVAVTYDGAAIRLYVNGAQVASRRQAGALAAGADPLRFGGDALWREWLRGRLDELRVYSRALTAAEIALDMRTPVGAAAAPASRTRIRAGAGHVRFRARRDH